MPFLFRRRDFLRLCALYPSLRVGGQAARANAAGRAVDIAAMRNRRGGAGRRIAHNDPAFPGANGGFTWRSGDPLRQGDNGGTVIAAAGPSRGWWVRDSLPNPPAAANRLKLDWWEMKNGKDIAPVLLNWAKSYRAIYADLSEDATELVCDRMNASAEKVFRLHLYEPSHPLTIRSGEWRWGSVDLMAARWRRNQSGLNPNEWSVTVPERAVSNLFLAHPSNGAPAGNQNPAGGAWLMDASKSLSDPGHLRKVPHWMFDASARRIRLYCARNPAAYFTALHYTTVYPDFIMNWRGVVDRYVGGPNHRLTFMGRKPRQPLSSENSSVAEHGKHSSAIAFQAPNLRPPRGKYEWHANIDNVFGNGLLDSGSNSPSMGIRRSTISGTFTEAPVRAYSPAHLHWADAAFVDKFHCGLGWTGQISGSGTDYGANVGNTSRWYYSRKAGGASVIYVGKTTGRTNGAAGFPFAGAMLAGNGAADPLVARIANANYTVHATHITRFRRPVFVDDQNSASNLLGKVDGLGTRRPGYYIKIIDDGVTDAKGRFRRVDIRRSPRINVLNVISDPAKTRLYMPDRPSLFSIEATSERPDWNYYQDHVHIQYDGIGAAPITLGTTEERHPGDFTGFHTVLGDGRRAMRCPIGMWDNCTVDNVRHARGASEFGVTTRSYNHYLARNNSIRNCVFENGDNVAVGKGAVNTQLAEVTFNGAPRKVVAADTGADEFFRRGQPVDIRLTGVSAPRGSTIDVTNPKKHDRSNLHIQVDGQWWRAPFTFGGRNRPGRPPPVLKRMGYAHYPISWSPRGQRPAKSAKLTMPARIARGDLMLLWLALDRDPGKTSLPMGWRLLRRANLRDGSLYCGLFWKVSDGKDWRYDNLRVQAHWLNACAGWSKIVHIVGQHAAPIGRVATQANAAAAAISSPTITTTADGSMVFVFAATRDDALVTSFGGPASPWVATVSRHARQRAFGWSMQGYYGYKRGGSIFAAEHRADRAGSPVACEMPLKKGAARSIAMAVEVKSG